MNKEQRKYENYLQALRKQVEKLPTKIWEYSDVEDKSYQDKRNYLLQEVIDIENKLAVVPIFACIEKAKAIWYRHCC